MEINKFGEKLTLKSVKTVTIDDYTLIEMVKAMMEEKFGMTSPEIEIEYDQDGYNDVTLNLEYEDAGTYDDEDIMCEFECEVFGEDKEVTYLTEMYGSNGESQFHFMISEPIPEK